MNEINYKWRSQVRDYKIDGGGVNHANKNISSAEMTAYWRTVFPEFSSDTLSIHLVSQAGVEKSTQFEIEHQYPLIPRKISVRAGYFLQEATRLLGTGKYDSCISFASGFSLLTYYIAKDINNKDIAFLDTDLSDILETRLNRIKSIHSSLDKNIASKLHSKILNLEKAAQENLSLKTLFPHCHTPLFILEGITYFLTEKCIQWLFKEILSFEKSAVIFDYFPENSMEVSECFARIFEPLRAIIPEQIKYFLPNTQIEYFKKVSSMYKDERIQTIENDMSLKLGQEPQFLDQNDFFPVRIVTAEHQL